MVSERRRTPPLRRSARQKLMRDRGDLSAPSRKLTGWGTLTSANFSYKGQWLDGKRHGHGTERQMNGRVPGHNMYVGEWENDLRHGHGTLKYPSGSVYEGQWQRGEKQKGKYTFVNGCTYDGEWKNNRRYGQGTERYPNGNTYEGQWKDDLRHGHGTFQGAAAFASGDAYEGQWKDDLRHGHGTERHANGDTYEGQWEDDLRHGQGTERHASGDTYEGQWEDDRRHGQGTERHASGDTYEGQWKDGKRHGRITVKNVDGETREALWLNGVLQPTYINPPAPFVCPISYEIMHDPVATVDGHSYERDGIERWLGTSNISPLTGLLLPSPTLAPNHNLRQSIVLWKEDPKNRER